VRNRLFTYRHNQWANHLSAFAFLLSLGLSYNRNRGPAVNFKV